jgi:hypothetical protein
MVWEIGFFGAAATAMLAGCLVPGRWLPPLPNDKLMHFAGFAGLTLLGLRIAHGRFEAMLFVVGLLVAGWAIECLQQLVPDRGFCWRDLAANAAGIAFMSLCSLGYAAL